MKDKKVPDEIADFFRGQSFLVITTVDSNGTPHSSCKGLVDISASGKVYLLDLYKGRTFNNLKNNPRINITGVDEHKFKGYCLKGSAMISSVGELDPQILKAWEERITARITQRVLKNVAGGKGHQYHPEALLPKPEYLISMQVEEIVDLSARQSKKEG